MGWYFRACPNCGGDLHDDLEDKGWLRCLQCSRSFAASRLDSPNSMEQIPITPKRRRRLRPESLRPPVTRKRTAA
jgi:hypothetical protein